MLSKADNEFVCRVGGGTPMGDMFRRYWWPVLLSSDLPEQGRACTPKRFSLLGDHYVAFRGTDGKVAIVDEACPHRGASLALGVVEECSIKCIYHGWRIGGDGTIQEAPNVSDPRVLKGLRNHIKARPYGVREAGDVVWAYIGPSDKEPAFPEFDWFRVPTRNRIVSAVVLDANYLQSIENLFDPSHLSVLHQDPMRKMTQVVDQATAASVLANSAPLLEVQTTEFGFQLAAIREHGDKLRVRAVVFVAPGLVFIPASPRVSSGGVLAYVPMSDSRTLQLTILWDEERPYNEEPLRSEVLNYFGLLPSTIDEFGISRETCDMPGKPSMENCFKQDRESIRLGESFTGIPDFIPEDTAVIVSQGAIRDRSREHLVPADAGVIQLRRTLIDAARRFMQGEAPIGLQESADTSTICSYEYSIPVDTAWQSMMPAHRSSRGSSTPAKSLEET